MNQFQRKTSKTTFKTISKTDHSVHRVKENRTTFGLVEGFDYNVWTLVRPKGLGESQWRSGRKVEDQSGSHRVETDTSVGKESGKS